MPADHPKHPTASLLLLGHGSHYNGDSSLPVERAADRIRKLNIFCDVHAACWKEEPNLSRALEMAAGHEVFIVPFFISSGYFTEQVLPREIGIGSQHHNCGRKIVYTAPIGTHPAMRTVLAKCIEETLENSGKTTLDSSNTTLILVGHGTTKNENSGAEVINMAEQIRREGVYASVLHAFMEESPYDHEVLAQVKTGQVVIVPYFVSEGFHTRDEIPQRMGLLKTPGNNLQNPVIISPTLTAWYTRAVGTHPAVDAIVLARVKESQTSHGGAGGCKDPSSISNTPKDSGKKSWCVGELLIEPHPEGYAVRHARDAAIPASQLEVIEPIEKLHNLSRFDIDGAYRPLRSAAGLRSGWIFCAASIEELELALDFVLPNAWRHQRLWLRKELIVRSYRETTARQSGIYAATAGLTKAEVQEVARECCRKTCQRIPVWPVEKNETAPVLPMELGSSREQLIDQGFIPCPELCSWAMEMARRKSKKTER